MSDEAWTDEDLGQLAADIYGIIEYGGSPGGKEELGLLKEYGRAERKRALEDAAHVASVLRHPPHLMNPANVAYDIAEAVRALIDEETPVARRKADGGETA